MPEERISRIINWINGVKQPPFSIEIRPTYKCNLNCQSCFKHADFYETEKEKNKDEISRERYLKLIKEAYSLGVKECLISGGGEPLLRSDTIDLMCEIKNNGMKGELITNGTLFDENMIQRLVLCKWDHLIISIDGHNSKINDYLRGKSGSFKKNILVIKKIAFYKKKFNLESPKITIATVLNNKNYDQIEKMIKLCKKNKIDNFRLQNLIVWSEKGKQLQLNEEEKIQAQQHVQKAFKLAERYSIQTNLKDFIKNDFLKNENTISFIKRSIKSENKLTNCFCYSPFCNISISENGKARHCQMSDVTEESIKEKSLKEIWYGPSLNGLRKMLLTQKIPDFCKNCCSPQVFDIISIRNKIESLT